MLRLPRYMVEQVCARLATPETDSPGQVERWLRDRAADWEREHEVFLGPVMDDESTDRFRAFMSSTGSPEAVSFGPRGATLRTLTRRSGVPPWSPEERGVIVHMIELLTWADDLAPDDYRFRPTAT